MTRQRVNIEKLVCWAYCDELPKDAPGGRFGPAGDGGAWRAIAAQGETMAATVSDGRPNAWGVLPLADGDGDRPHPDAVLIGRAVSGLADVGFTLPDGWAPFDDMNLGEDADRLTTEARAVLEQAGAEPAAVALDAGRLIITHAVLGSAPAWQADPITRRYATHANGRAIWFIREQRLDSLGYPMEVETMGGWDARRGRARDGAYRKPLYAPQPGKVARRRAEYQVWVTALDYVAACLAGQMEAFEPMETGRPLQPWLDGAGGPRVLPAIAT